MNNDEQMIALLTSISSDITGMKEDISGLKKGQAEIKQDIYSNETRYIKFGKRAG